MQERDRLPRDISMRRLMQAYQAVLVALACALIFLASGHGLGNPFAVAGLMIVAAVSERGRVSLGGVTEASISLLPTVFAAGVFGPLAGALVAAASLAGDFPDLL